ncbi:hypothetical protein C8R45DRAFT_1112222 [Mycena sanguinolenta]|nr:hypothetical protein C8R45DRAFT_1112222 [Mycena sanguinolenta]
MFGVVRCLLFAWGKEWSGQALAHSGIPTLTCTADPAADTLPRTSHTPATQVGTGTSASGRAWIGTGGGGGAREWWDNKGGRNYEVRFRCVDVEEPAAPAPAPATMATAVETKAIPFPPLSADTDADAAPLSFTRTPAPPSRSPSAPAQPVAKPIPPLPSLRTAQAQALAARLSKLSLRNYAAPARLSVVPALVSPAVAAGGEQQKESDQKEGERNLENERPQPAPGTQGTGLYWPRGRAPASLPAPPVPQTKEDSASHSSASDASDDEDADAARRDAADGRTRRRGRKESNEPPPTSPLGAEGLLPVIEGLVSSPADEKMGMEGEETPSRDKLEPTDIRLPVSPPPVSPTSSSPPSPASPVSMAPTSPPSLGATSPASSSSSRLYKAFVRQWCYAGAGNGNGVVILTLLTMISFFAEKLHLNLSIRQSRTSP